MTRKRADLLLVERGFFDSRAKAQSAVATGGVSVDGIRITKPSKLIDAQASIIAEPSHPYVSRGGVKLAFALDNFGVLVEGRVALDVGASTGGFCDVLLKRGALRVYAVDKGHDQLHPTIANDPRIVSLQGVDARRLSKSQIPGFADLITIDVSFISLALVLEPALAFAAPSSCLVALIKPQFEAGREHIRRGGIVRDEAARRAACERICDRVTSLGWAVRGVVASPILGGDGNQEFLLVADRAS